MKYTFYVLIILFGLFSSQFSLGQIENIFYSKADKFFKKHVSHNKVNYEGVKNDIHNLNELLLEVENYVPLNNPNNNKSFYINAYNLLVINQIANEWPIQSPNDIYGFFDANKFMVSKQALTLNELENNILRKQFNDPRLHFVLVCGANGCPPIADFAYRPAQLEEQLNQQTKLAINDKTFIYENGNKSYISQIFNWYKEDFGSNKDIFSFINSYRDQPLKNQSLSFYPYDWSVNNWSKTSNILPISDEIILPPTTSLQKYTAGTLLAKGLWDITLFNSLYTQTKSNWLGQDFSGVRETFYTTLLQATLGTTKNKRVNLGFDISFRGSAKRSDASFGTTFDAFSFKNNDSTRVGISSIGPRIKWIPFAGNSDFSIQSSFTVPTTRYNEGKSGPNGLSWLDWNRFTSWTQFFYTRTSGDFQLFLEADILARIRTSKSQITHADVPLTVIGSWFISPKWTAYGIIQHNTRFVYNINPTLAVNDFIQPMNYTAPGLGIKFQPVPNIVLEALYTNFVRGVNTGLGETFNFGIKYYTKRSKKAK